MSIFVIGRSRSGKSPVAEKLSAILEGTHVPCSRWARESFICSPHIQSRQDWIAAIVAFSLRKRKHNPKVGVDYIRSHFDLRQFCIIDGIRSLDDFIHLFNPARDTVLFLEYQGNFLKPTMFEEGISLIKAHLNLQCRLGQILPQQMSEYHFASDNPDAKVETPLVAPVFGPSPQPVIVNSVNTVVASFIEHVWKCLPLADKWHRL